MKIIREHFPIEFRKPKTKVITVASQINKITEKITGKEKYSPIRKLIRKKKMEKFFKAREKSAGKKRGLPSRAWLLSFACDWLRRWNKFSGTVRRRAKLT